MEKAISNEIARQLRDRRALLWICQRYDLIEGEQPHDYDVPVTTAALRYRPSPAESDRKLAEFFWESVWLEGAASPALNAIREVAEQQPPVLRRQVVVLAGSSDAHAHVSPQEFLPICVLPGLLDPSASPDARYGAVRGRSRSRTAWDLASRIRMFRGRALVVIGARSQDDLSQLYEVLEDSPATDLRVVIVWPEGLAEPMRPANPAVDFVVWSGSELEFVHALWSANAPAAGDLPRWAVRVGKRTVTLTPKEAHRIVERFALITERDLLPAANFTLNDLHDFLKGSLENWLAYASGLPVGRTYTSEAGKSVTEELFEALEQLPRKDSQVLTFIVQLPCESGAGATTLLRSAAYLAAREGHPTLILRPEEVDLNLEDLLALTTALSEAALSAGIEDIPPFVIVLDVEHAAIKAANQVAQLLASHGRRAVILQATRDDGQAFQEKRSKRIARLRLLTSQTTREEVEGCEKTFREVVVRWHVPLEIPSIEHWQSYQARTSFYTPGGTEEPSSMFWVALRFFLAEGAEFTTRNSLEDALGAWLNRRIPNDVDVRISDFVAYVAALSSFRLVSPVWTVLRPVTGGTFSSELISVIHALRDIIIWGDYSEDLDDQVLRFAHPSLADEFLRQRGIRSPAEKAQLLGPVLTALSSGHPGDVWLAESFAAVVLVPSHEARSFAEWDWRLNLFSLLPPMVRDQSKTILHHWARCLYLSVDRTVLPSVADTERAHRLELAIEKLKKATELPRKPGRDEHPSHLFNTLGTAYTRYANLLEHLSGRASEAGAAWNEACRAFDRSIGLSPGSNIEALLAYSLRLLEHAGRNVPDDPVAARQKTGDVAKALGHLDEAEEILREHAAPAPEWNDHLIQYRARALAWLSEQGGLEYLHQLQQSQAADLGYYCEARLLLSREDDDLREMKALQLLEQAEQRGIRPEPRSIILRLSLLRADPQRRFDFPLLLTLHEDLERSPGYTPRPVDVFRHAVLCYQTGKFQEGAERFRRLREHLRRSEAVPPRVRDRWRSADNPNLPHLTQVRVTRITTEWRAEGYADELRQYVPLRPRHFSPPPRENEVVPCVIRFEANGPLAVPPRFEELSEPHPQRRPR